MKLRHLYVVLLAFIVFIFASCDQKSPVKGYLTDEQVDEIIAGFSPIQGYKFYAVEGTLNYLDKPEEIIPGEAYGTYILEESLEKYDSKKGVSYYLRLPLHITERNWNYYDEDTKYSQSTKVRIDSTLLTVGKTLDEVYFYQDANGNLIIKTYGANKALKIAEGDIVCHAKWNVTIVYNKDGYLISEKFETINSHKDPDTKTCYGQAEYRYF